MFFLTTTIEGHKRLSPQ